MTESWTKWEGDVVNGTFPLRRYLGGSDHSGVFLTEHTARNHPNAAIKLVPADAATAEAQLSQWRSAAALSHPHLIRLLDADRCRRGGDEFLFVVMEYAEETLSQILPHRALTPKEVREMLNPTLEALAYLHAKDRVQGQLKPSNFLVVDDQVKLASDTIRRAGESTARIASLSVYDPPEAINGRISAAGDMWALGITMVKALTQRLPEWSDERSKTATLPASLPPEFEEAARRCLSPNPADRPSASELETLLTPTPPAPTASMPPPPAAAPTASIASPAPAAPTAFVASPAPVAATASMPLPAPAAPTAFVASPAPVSATASKPSRAPAPPMAAGAAVESPTSRGQRALVPAIALLLIVIAAVWAGLRLYQRHPDSGQAAATSTAAASPTVTAPPTVIAPPRVIAPATVTARPKVIAPPKVSAPAAPPRAVSVADTSRAVLHEEIPNVSRSARATIHGQINVAVRVTVDSGGNVVDETLEDPGPSKYFARLATAAAKKWRFAPADSQGPRQAWLLRFEFTRSGAAGYAATPRS